MPRFAVLSGGTGAKRAAAVMAAAAAVALLTTVSGTVPGGPSQALLVSSATVSSNEVTAGRLAAPTNVTVSYPSPNQVLLTWTKSSSTWADGYLVYRAAQQSGPYTQVATVSGVATTTWTDTDAPRGISYYRLRTYKNNWNSTDLTSGPATTPIISDPPAPGASVESTRVTVSWAPVPDAVSYNVYEYTCAHKPEPSSLAPGNVACAGLWDRVQTLKTNTTATSVTFDDNFTGQQYDFRVAAVDINGMEGPKNAATLQVSTIPTTPSWVEPEIDIAYGIPYERVRVNHPTTGTRVELEVSENDGAYTPLPATPSSATNWGDYWVSQYDGNAAGWIPPHGGRTRLYRARSCNDAGCSPWVGQWFNTSAVSYNYTVLTDKPIFRHRFTHTAAGATPDLLNYTGTASQFQFSQCPFFRACTSPDRALTMLGAQGVNGYASRSGPLFKDHPDAWAPRTWEFSYKQRGSWVAGRYLFGQNGTPGQIDPEVWGMRTSSTTNKLTWINGKTFPGTAKMADGQWHMYHVVWDWSGKSCDGTVTLYEDGVSLGSVSACVNTDRGMDVTLGGFYSNDVRGAAGTYDEWAIYKRSFPASEVADHWRARLDGD